MPAGAQGCPAGRGAPPPDGRRFLNALSVRAGGSGGFEEVESQIAAGVVVAEGGCCDEVAKLGDHPAEGVALGRERADDEGDLEAKVVWVGDNTAEAVELAGEDVALAGFVEWNGRSKKGGR